MLTQLCLVSAQATPNLTPALDPATRPRRVILLVSPDMHAKAEWLEQVLRPRGVRVDRWPIDDAWDVEGVQSRLLELLDRERDAMEAGAIALNATGGTKPMSIAAYEVFRELRTADLLRPPGAGPADLDAPERARRRGSGESAGPGALPARLWRARHRERVQWRPRAAASPHRLAGRERPRLRGGAGQARTIWRARRSRGWSPRRWTRASSVTSGSRR